jgi:hypothetical protein
MNGVNYFVILLTVLLTVSLTVYKRLRFQVIKTTDTTFLGEIIGDTIKVSRKNFWEIKLNVQTGIIESWKVVY